MLIDVLTRLSADTGYHLTDQRASLINLTNRAADTIHKMLECNKMFREVTLVVSPDSVVTLPSYIGEIRGLRMHTNELPFDLHSIGSPRYTSSTLSFKFKNWRDLGESVVHTLPTLVGQLTIESNVVETTPVQLLISGQTNLAARIEETITLNAASKTTVNLFGPQIYKIACLTERTGDIVIKDANGTEIATLYNTENQTRYKLIDVSQVFWTLDTAAGESFIDLCYKVKASRLIKDTDSFYAGDDYDNAWYHMAMHHYFSPLTGREVDSTTQHSLSVVALQSIKDGSEQEIVKKATFGRNKFYGLFRKYRYYPGSVTNVDHNIQ